MKKSDKYLKIVEWSEEHQCYVGTCPGLLTGGGIYGDDEAAVYKDLCRYAREWIEIMERDGVPLPEETAMKEYSGKFVLRTGKELHRELAIKAMHRGVSLNAYCLELIKKKI
jgi:predicted HicB family RNase H-like nuclease